MQPNPQEIAGLVASTEELLHGNLHFLCSVSTVQDITTNTVSLKP